ncbi:DMT family transporter [archaeon]|nr:DMT family transporter [archaeon]
MDFSLGFLYALIPLVGWGTADFVGKLAIQKESYYKVLFYSHLLGIPPLVLFIAFTSGFQIPSPDVSLMILVLGVLWSTGFVAFYKAIEVGKLSVISPVAASWGMIAALIGIAFLGEQLTFSREIGIVLTVVGVILASTSFVELRTSRKFLMKGIPYAFYAMFAWGLMFAYLGKVVVVVGPYLPVLLIKSILVVGMLIFAPLTKKSINFPVKSVVPLILLNAFLEVIAFIGLNLGLATKEFVSIVSPTAAAFPAVTVILAFIFLKERVEINQVIGILSIIMGVVLMALI